MSLYEHKLYVKTVNITLSEPEAVYALREAWKKIYNEYPKDKSLALLYAQSCLETGRWKECKNNNFGNIKKKFKPDDGHFFTMFATGENLWDNKTKTTKWHWFEPPHSQTAFRAYENIVDGAEDYLKLISQKSRYIKAWQEVLNGDPVAFSKELKNGGYYTAPLDKYTSGVVRLFNEFINNKEELLAYKPASQELTQQEPVSQKDKALPLKEDVVEIDTDNEAATTSEDKIVVKSTKPNQPKSIIAVFIAAILGAIYYLFNLL